MKATNENRTIKAVAALLIIFYLLMGFVLNDTTRKWVQHSKFQKKPFVTGFTGLTGT